MSGSKIKILLVEDECTLAEIIADTLGEKGFEVKVAHNGVEALKVFKSDSYNKPAQTRGTAVTEFSFVPDVVVTDIMMPQMDGLTFIKELRKIYPGLPVMFLSARTTAEDVVEGFETGGNDYLRKPFAMSELIIRIKSLIARTGGYSSENPGSARINGSIPGISADKASLKEFKIGKFTFDPERMTLKFTTGNDASLNVPVHSKETIATGLIQLSTRESQVLAMLCAQIGQLVPSKDILINLWGDDNYFNSRSLQVYITKLRKHFELDSSINLSNVRGVGYKLFVPQF